MGHCNARPRTSEQSNQALKGQRSRLSSQLQPTINPQEQKYCQPLQNIRQDFLERYPTIKQVPNSFYSVISSAQIPYDFQFAEYITRDDLREHTERIQLSLTMDHPGLVKLFDCYESQNGYYLVYEEVRGLRINDIKGKLKDLQIRDIAYQLLKTFEFIHKKGLIHGGLDERSFIFPTQSWVKLFSYVIPFRTIQQKTDRQASVSTYFKPPEVLEGKEPTSAADIWGLAILIQYLYLGKTIFEDKNELLVQKRITLGNYLLGSSGLSNEARDFVDDILQLDPTKRPTASKLLKHRWFSVLKPPPLSQLSHLHNAPDTDEIDKTSLTYQLSKVYFDHMREKIFRVFATIDTNNDGVLSKQELIATMTKKFKGEPVQSLISHLIEQIENAKQQQLTFRDFLGTIFDDTVTPDTPQILKIYKFLERDVGKKVSIRDVMDYLGSINVSINQDVVAGPFVKSDKDRDNCLNYKEFADFFDRGLDIQIYKIPKVKKEKKINQKSSSEEEIPKKKAKVRVESKDIEMDTNEILLKARQRRMARVVRSEVNIPQTQSTVTTSSQIPLKTQQTMGNPVLRKPSALIAPHQRIDRHRDSPDLKLQHAQTVTPCEPILLQMNTMSQSNNTNMGNNENLPKEQVDQSNSPQLQKKKKLNMKNGATNRNDALHKVNKRFRGNTDDD